MYKAPSLAEEHHFSSYLWDKKEPVKFRIWEVVFNKSFTRTTYKSHESQATLMGYGGPNSIHK